MTARLIANQFPGHECMVFVQPDTERRPVD